MTVASREQAVKNALASQSATPGTCQLWTRTQFGAPSAGDRDRDNDADANDGWLSEPVKARHFDRKFPAGVPLYFKNSDGTGFGHRTVSLPGGKTRSIDISDDGTFYQPGNVGSATIEQVERAMGLTYVGWSETITGLPIPFKTPKPVKNTSRGVQVDKALEDAEAVLKSTTRAVKNTKQADRKKQLELCQRRAELLVKGLEKVSFIK